LAEIQANEDAWLHNTSRQDNIAVQRHANTIFIRSFPKIRMAVLACLGVSASDVSSTAFSPRLGNDIMP
jgi:hypothetical protein